MIQAPLAHWTIGRLRHKSWCWLAKITLLIAWYPHVCWLAFGIIPGQDTSVLSLESQKKIPKFLQNPTDFVENPPDFAAAVAEPSPPVSSSWPGLWLHNSFQDTAPISSYLFHFFWTDLFNVFFFEFILYMFFAVKIAASCSKQNVWLKKGPPQAPHLSGSTDAKKELIPSIWKPSIYKDRHYACIDGRSILF